MKFIENLITDESQICFTNGDKITGAKAISDLILKSCEEYNAGYLEGRNALIAKGILIGGLVTGTIIGINKFIEHKNKTQK